MIEENIVQCESCFSYRDFGTECKNPCCQKEEKQMGGEWFEWEDGKWGNLTKGAYIEIETFFEEWAIDLYQPSANLGWRKKFFTKEEALSFARDFMAKNGGL